jgi:hypothetical protein
MQRERPLGAAPAAVPILATLALALGVFSTLAAPPAAAVICTLDNVPAATLLLPYFAVNLDDPLGQTTLFSIVNASGAAELAHVVLWTDLGVPTLVFDVYLTGRAVQSINLRDIFVYGRLPQTLGAAQGGKTELARSQGEEASPVPAGSAGLGPGGSDERGVPRQATNGAAARQTEIIETFPNCTDLPLPPQPIEPLLAYLRAAHTGNPSPMAPGMCSGANHGDAVARGYITVDTVNACSGLTPADPGYFGAGGLATADNVLLGDYFYVDSRRTYAEGGNLVRIEADPSAFKSGDSTFYEVYVGHTAADAREPLPSTWAARFLSGGPFDALSDMIVWREPVAAATPFPCGMATGGFPLYVQKGVAFDEQESPGVPCSGAACAPMESAAPYAANRVQIGGPAFAVPFSFGWFIASFDLGFIPPVRQAWLGTVINARQQISVAMAGTPLDSGCGSSASVP